MRTRMAPFPTLPEKTCENPECKRGADKKPIRFRPVTPWQRTCCPNCRNRLNYLEVRRDKLRAELLARGGPKKRGRKPKASINGGALGASTPPASRKPEKQVGENPITP
jgi:hypothetical protein